MGIFNRAADKEPSTEELNTAVRVLEWLYEQAHPGDLWKITETRHLVADAVDERSGQ